MIDVQQYEMILKSGLLLDHYMILCKMRDSEEIPKGKRVQGFLNLLNKKGFIEDGGLTKEAISLIQEKVSTVMPTDDKPTDFSLWVYDVHKKCQNKLLELTGCKQVKDKIDTKYYSFLPNVTDMAKVLYRANVVYKFKDLSKIEKCILNYIDKCYKARSWFPLMKYYIMKNNSSDMMTDLDSIDEIENEGKSLQKFV